MQRVIKRGIWRAVRRVLALLILIGVLIIGTGAAIVVQGGRDESQPATTAIVLVDGDGLQVDARLDRAMDLYLKGQVGQIVLIGQDPTQQQATLLERGVQTVKLTIIRGPTQRDQMDQLQSTTVAGQSVNGLLIAEPVQMLRLLKMAHDRGLALRGAPWSSTSRIDMGAVVDETLDYFGYILGLGDSG